MPRAYSADLRERLLRAETVGLPAAEIARTTGISVRSLRRWRLQQTQTGSLAPKRPPGRPPKIPVADQAALRADVLAHADATLAEHCERWQTAHATSVSRATMSRLLAKLGLPLKKNR